MTAMVLTAAYLAINSGDISANCKKIELTVEVEEKDITTFSSLGWKTVTGGIKSGAVAVAFLDDFADNELDEDLWTLFGTVTTFEVRASSGSVTASNPKYTGSCLIKELKPVSGGVGDVAEQDVTWPTSGVVTRGTT